MAAHRFHHPDLSELLDGVAPPVGPGDATVDGLRITLPDAEAHHARRVLRMTDGDAAELFDGCGRSAAGVIVGVGRGVEVVLRRAWFRPPLAPRLTLAVAMPKGGRADDMVNALSQLGVDRLVPLATRRAVVQPRDAKLNRFRKAAVESAKQCGRDYLMEIAQAATLDDVLAETDADLRLCGERNGAWDDDSSSRLRRATHVLVLIGPEGGFTRDERARMDEAGVSRIRLGPHTLRIETAALAAAAIVRSATSPPRP